MRKTAILSTILAVTIFAIVASPVFAYVPINSTDAVGLNYGDYTGLGTKDIREGIMSIVNAMLAFLGVIAILIVLYGGFVWLTSGGNEEKVGEAKKIIAAGVIGLIIIFTAYAIATFVVGSLISATT